MKSTKRKVLTGVGITLAIIFGIVAVVIIFISPISKYVIEKYDIKFLGREVKMNWIYVNPFTGYAHISNLRLYEQNSDSVFFSADGVSINFAIMKAIGKTYEIEDLTISHPYAKIIQNRQAFNFDDMIQKFASKDTVVVEVNKKPVKFSILDVAIEDGEFHYIEQTIPVNYFVKEVNISTKGKRWDVDTVAVKFALKSGPSTGDIKGDFSINLDSMEYRVAAQVNKFDLQIVEQYLQDLANYGSFTANLDADIKASGNMKEKLAVTASGYVGVNDFHFGKNRKEDYLSFDKLAINMTKVDPRHFQYYMDTIMINKPFFKYERYDYLDNIQREFGVGGSKIKAANADSAKFNLIIEIAKYVQDIGKNFLQSYYKINKLAIYNGDIHFNDYSLREKFAVAANPLNIRTDTLDKSKERMNIWVNTGIKPYGSFAAHLSLDPNDYGYFDLDYKLLKVPVSMLNPYVISYTSFPLDRGTVEFGGYLNLLDSNISSNNHLLIIDVKNGKRIKKKDTKWIPVPLILSIVRNRGEAVDYSLPISGSLKDPKFHLWPAIFTTLGNIFIKPPTTPYLQHVKDVENQVEKYLTVKWGVRQSELTSQQDKFVDKMADFMKSNADASITVTPLVYADKEKESILFYEAKKKYYAVANHMEKKEFLESDSAAIDKMSVKDSGFVRYLNKVTGDTMMFTVQEKCMALIGPKAVEARYIQLIKAREAEFRSYFDKSAVARIKINPAEVFVPYNGFSYYKIDYKGEIPDKLMKAYEEINDLNDESPRAKYLRERKKNGGVLVEEKETKKKMQ